ncbi:MAG: VanZ family protein [Magnetococcales bacterium]|nr:VanZ family protein [Magnetococcales bacterium]NGZ27246.1 VanZ family protein [Magnetococcales bacterium]
MPLLFKKDRTLAFWLLLLFGYCGWIYYLSSGPVSLGNFQFPGLDKILHMGAYGLMAAIAWQVLHRSPWVDRTYLGAWAWCALYGISDEWHQSFTGRYPDVEDWVADVVGAALMLWLIQLYFRHFQPQTEMDSTKTQLS